MSVKTDADRQRDRGTRLLALALAAHHDGNANLANGLALLTSESFNKAEEIKRRMANGHIAAVKRKPVVIKS
jgi:hypothetical protein